MDLDTKKKKILIVDDEISIINSVINTFDESDYNILAARNGRKAYYIISRTTPDLIITDWEMPGMNGLELVRKIKKEDKYKGIPVIMITGVMNTIENFKLAFESGVTDFIRKPIDPIELVARTNSMLLLANYYKETIQKKDFELTLLAKNIYYNNEFNNKLILKLDDFKKNHLNNGEISAQKIDDLRNEINSKIKSQSWEDFERRFRIIHPGFIENIIIKYPKLTGGDIKLCILLKLNLNSKEIASITFQNPDSVDIARHRLRKKLELGREVNLYTFLMNF